MNLRTQFSTAIICGKMLHSVALIWILLHLTNRCTSSASILLAPFPLPVVFIEALVVCATMGEVNKMSEEMLSFIVSIMHNTPAL